jgi:hypothetical protein
MNRSEKRKIKRKRIKSTIKNKTYEPPSKKARLITITISLTVVFAFLYLALRDNTIPENELSTIYVTLKKKPKYDEYTIKRTTYRDIILTTKEYNRDFKITAWTYKATNHEAFKSNILAKDQIELKVKKSKLDELDKNTFWNDYNDVYQLTKNSQKYIDLELRTELIDNDSKWGYFVVIIGLIFLPYGFIKSKPLINMDKAIIATTVIGLITVLIYNIIK